MNNHLEPTYLRYIYDGLIKGSIHPENAAELPEGLIGLYEEAFDERQPVHLRQQLLQRFAIWALLKKEISAQFIAEVLNQSEDEIQEFIATYSAWFNSPESGKFQLYHERLKVYLLQKLSESEVHVLHEKLISRLERAIEEQKADEFEWYGLEFLTQHNAVNAMLNGDGSKLLDLAYNQKHWQRQQKISKGYIWTKAGLHSVMNWASKYNDDEVIECGLQLVDLHHQEQNAAPQIVALVAEGDFDSALKRIEQFGGNDKEGLQRKFILYMLCLMELTLLESKNKPFRTEGIEKLLKHLDEQLPVDHSVLNWGEFFSSYLMVELAFEWADLKINYLTIFKFCKPISLDFDKRIKYNKLSNHHLDILICIIHTKDFYKLFDKLNSEVLIEKISFFNEIAIKNRDPKLIIKTSTFIKLNNIDNSFQSLNETAIELINEIKEIGNQIDTCMVLIDSLLKQGNDKEYQIVLNQLLAINSERDEWGFETFLSLSQIYKNNEKVALANSSLKKAIILANKITVNEYLKSYAFCEIACLQAQYKNVQGMFISMNSVDISDLIECKLKLVNILFINKLFHECNLIMKELENTLITITKEKQRDNLLVKISEEYLNQRNYVKSLALISDINQSAVKAKALIYCIVSIRSLGFIPELKWFYYELQKLTSQLTSHKNEQLLKSIYLDLYKYDIDQNEIDIKQLSFLVLNNDKIKFQKDKIILNIIDSHVKYGDFALNDSLLNSISNRFDRINGVLIISKSLVKRSQTQKALEIIEKHLHNADDIDTVLGKIIELLIDFKQFKLSMNLVKRIEDNSLKSFLLQELSIKCFKINKVLLSNSALKLAHETTLKIKDDLFKIFGLVGMAETYVKLGKLPEFERIIKDIDLLKNTQEEIFKENIEGVLEKKFTAIKLYTGDIELTKQLIKKRNNSLDLVDIIPHLIKNGFIKFAISTLDNITDLNIRLLSISKIAHELKLTGEKKISNQLIDDLISEIKKCKNGTIKDKTIIKIMVDLLEVGDFCSAEIIDRTVSGAGFQMKNWKNILHTSGLKLDNVRFYEKINQIESKELRKLCEQEWLLKGRILDFDKKNSVHPIILCSRDLSTLSTVVSYNVLNQIYFGKTTEEQIGRYLETFDLQWAIDIKNQLPN